MEREREREDQNTMSVRPCGTVGAATVFAAITGAKLQRQFWASNKQIITVASCEVQAAVGLSVMDLYNGK